MAHILVVDDDRSIRDLLWIALAGSDPDHHTVELASNGREALEMWRSRQNTPEAYDLVVTDLQMPEMDGLQLMAALPESLPVILTTAQGEPPHSFHKTPSRETCVKPFASMAAFVEQVNTLLTPPAPLHQVP